ncbi:MAG TPA: GlxA family transcriptional regulator [Oculatellaceae cyanobacterium]
MKKRVAFLLCDGVQLLDFAGPHDVLSAANQYLHAEKKSGYEIVLLGERSIAKLAESETIAISDLQNSKKAVGPFHTLIVPGGQRFVGKPPKTLVTWLANVAPNCKRIVSVCTGSYLLAAAGLLEGRNATTHWMFVRHMQRKFPNVQLCGDRVWVKDGPIYTSAGVTSGIDLALAIVEEDFGPKLALSVARALVVYIKRPGGQSQFSALIDTRREELSEFEELQSFVLENLKRDLSVSQLADHCNMSERNFARRFEQIFHSTPAKYVRELRLETAKSLLTETDLTVGQIARKCGYSNDDIFRKNFSSRFSLTPSEFRNLWNIQSTTQQNL